MVHVVPVTTTFNTTLIATNKKGCSDSIVKNVTVNSNPLSNFTFTKTGKTYTFKAGVSGYAKYIWYWGNGDSVISAYFNFQLYLSI